MDQSGQTRCSIDTRYSSDTKVIVVELDRSTQRRSTQRLTIRLNRMAGLHTPLLTYDIILLHCLLHSSVHTSYKPQSALLFSLCLFSFRFTDAIERSDPSSVCGGVQKCERANEVLPGGSGHLKQKPLSLIRDTVSFLPYTLV